MDEAYFIGRMRASLEMARNAAGSAARLIHFDLAGRYSLAAARYALEHPQAWFGPMRPGDNSFHGNDNHRRGAGKEPATR